MGPDKQMQMLVVTIKVDQKSTVFSIHKFFQPVQHSTVDGCLYRTLKKN
jgi:hypothetical protein